MRRRATKPEPSSLVAPDQATTIEAGDRLHPVWPLDPRLPGDALVAQDALRWATQHAPDLMLPDDVAQVNADRRHDIRERVRARKHTNNN